MFGNATEVPQRETTPFQPRSPYGISKLAGFHLTRNYRDAYRLYAVSGILFNHESPRRGLEFVTRKTTSTVARIKLGLASELRIGNLDARRDMHDVRDTVRAYRLILEHGADGRAYNVCSGRAISIRALLDRLLAHARVPIRIRVDPSRYRPNDVPLLLGDPTRVQTELGWLPQIDLDQTIEDLLAYWRMIAGEEKANHAGHPLRSGSS